MTEKRHRTGENSGKNAEKTAVRVARRCVRLRQGGEAALCVLDTGDAPERERDSLTSMGAGVVLSSTAVRLGEHGTVHELAEGELFRVYISFYLPNTMDGDDTAELNCTLTGPELKALIEDLDQACARFPERK